MSDIHVGKLTGTVEKKARRGKYAICPHTKAGDKAHSCTYEAEIYNNQAKECRCCEACEKECARMV